MKKAILCLLFSTFVLPFLAQKNNYNLLIGTYTNSGKSQGIYSYNVNMKSGVFKQVSVLTGITNPSFLAITPSQKHVYSVSESADGSAANAFSFDKKTGRLTRLNASLTKSEGPCFISVSAKHVITANYGGGSISVFGRNTDGSLTDLVQLIQHVGGSINVERQNEPHVHQVIFTPDGQFLVANDLGTDKVTVYRYNPEALVDVLIPFDSVTVKPGSGPRHLTFSKDGNRIYLLQEIDGTVTVLGLNNGRLNILQETSVAKKVAIVNRAADIHLSPDGKFLYATNRGTGNDISCFSVEGGLLTFKEQLSTGGNGPRNFTITPDGCYVFVANQESDNIVIFKRNKKTGSLIDTGKRINVGAPVCLVVY